MTNAAQPALNRMQASSVQASGLTAARMRITIPSFRSRSGQLVCRLGSIRLTAKRAPTTAKAMRPAYR